MLIKESAITMGGGRNILTKLNEAVYLSQEESKVNPLTIPVREMTRFGEGYTMVRFSDVERLAEDSGVSYMDAVAAIAEASDVDASKMTIAVDEEYIIENGMDISSIPNIVVAPVSESSLAYRYVTECINSWADKESTAEVDAMLEAALVEDAELDDFASKATKEAEVDLAAAMAKPPAWISQKIGSLRTVYAKFMQRAEASQDTGIKAKLKKVAAKILRVIDKLMQKLQNYTDRDRQNEIKRKMVNLTLHKEADEKRKAVRNRLSRLGVDKDDLEKI